MAVALNETEILPATTMGVLICTISKTADGESISEIEINTAREINNNGKRTFKFTIVSGGRYLWQQWMDNGDLFMSLSAAEAYRIRLSAFPSDPRRGHGYVELIQAVE